MLGDLGAEVIKVERPPSGDFARWISDLSSQLMSGADSDVNYYFEIHNRNKKGIAVQAQKDRGREIRNSHGAADTVRRNGRRLGKKYDETTQPSAGTKDPRLSRAVDMDA